ncbi:unnamed protein product [Gordionus sp. m RMFG-2023]
MSLYLCTKSFENLVYRNCFKVLKPLIYDLLKRNSDICFLHTNQHEKEYVDNLIKDIIYSSKYDELQENILKNKGTLNDVTTIDKLDFEMERIEKSTYDIAIIPLNSITDEKDSTDIKCNIVSLVLKDILENMSSNNTYDCIIMLSALNWTINTEDLLIKIGRLLKSNAPLYILTWDLPPTCLIYATNKIIKQMVILNKLEMANGNTTLHEMEKWNKNKKLPWRRDWMRDTPLPILSKLGEEVNEKLVFVLRKMGFKDISAYYLNKVAFYCYENEEAINDFTKCMFFSDSYNLLDSINNNLISFKLPVPLAQQPIFIKDFSEFLMEDNMRTNGHKLNSYQSLLLYTCYK